MKKKVEEKPKSLNRKMDTRETQRKRGRDPKWKREQAKKMRKRLEEKNETAKTGRQA